MFRNNEAALIRESDVPWRRMSWHSGMNWDVSSPWAGSMCWGGGGGGVGAGAGIEDMAEAVGGSGYPRMRSPRPFLGVSSQQRMGLPDRRSWT